MPTAPFMCLDGEIVPYGEAKIHAFGIAPETVGLPVVERTVDRSELYACEEAFWCGSGQEIVPILSVDRIPVGAGRIGPITRALQERYFQIVRGEAAEYRDWLTPVWGSC